MSITIKGVYSIEAKEPCHLIEVVFGSPECDYDWNGITQEVPGQPRDNWQVPWDEQCLENSKTNWVFFFHYLDLSKPLITSDGPLELPPSSSVPDYLRDINYEEP